MKTCIICKVEKQIGDFYTSFNRQLNKVYYSSYCKTCNTVKTREYRHRDRDRFNAQARGYNIKRRYGLTAEQYREFIKDGCEVCGSFVGLAVDHDHACCPDGSKTCGKCLRGALCRRHNWAVANLNDSAEEAERIAEYLRKQVAR